MELLALILGLPLMLITIVALPWIGRLILGPINTVAGYLQAPTRFQLSDFVWLLVKLQIVLAICVQFVGVETSGYFEILLTFWTFAVIAMWAGAISFLSRARIVDPRRRACFTLLVLPGTLGILIGTPLLLSAICLMPLQQFNRAPHSFQVYSWQRVGQGIALGVLAVVAMLAAGWCLRKLSQWVAAGTTVYAAELVPEATPLAVSLWERERR